MLFIQIMKARILVPKHSRSVPALEGNSPAWQCSGDDAVIVSGERQQYKYQSIKERLIKAGPLDH